ncbi:hypothetical protein LY90DRAFT_448780 [Neocallimastix californiae]|uniref:P-loop containing nucleoside triphosphate hydrolase protein n=1 Tax=Neocallimastix californiae TaxID=1754190 RepID=A0A1Y2FHH9_9FUNG|nr:hypothetical protein LY90DRAFT_448780 [Neocallimastix californiae]|eukprot:ORY83421.1 hypothetical protein LY90DRAFT_448780 [Neocallimastix californiae]
MKREMASINNQHTNNFNFHLPMNNSNMQDSNTIIDVNNLASLSNINHDTAIGINKNTINTDVGNDNIGNNNEIPQLNTNNIPGVRRAENIYDLIKQNTNEYNNLTVGNDMSNNISMNSISNGSKIRNEDVSNLITLNQYNNSNNSIAIKNSSSSINIFNNSNSNDNSNDVTISNIISNSNSNSQSSLENIKNMNLGLSNDVYDTTSTTQKNNTNDNKYNISNIISNIIKNNNNSSSSSQLSNKSLLNNSDIINVDYSKPSQSLKYSDTNSNLNVNIIPHDTTIVIPDTPNTNSTNININENKKKKSIDVIDLTDDTNDDDVKIISSTYNKIENPNKRARLVETITRSNNINSYNSLNDEVIDLTSENYTLVKEPIQCFGTISTYVYCVRNPEFFTIHDILPVQLYPYKENLHVLIDRNGPIAVGILDKKVSECLYPLFSALKCNSRIPKTTKMHEPNTLRIEITLFGTKSLAKILGPILYQKKVNISIPIISLPPGTIYYNPVTGFGHIPVDENLKPVISYPQTTAFKSNNNMNQTITFNSNNSINNNNETLKAQIDKVFDSLKSIDELPELEPNRLINTPLYKYQKQALYFMVQREKSANEDYFRKDSLWKLRESKLKNYPPEYVNSITKTVSKVMPKKVQGGIIADDMGLGKTFQMLCLIMNYYNESSDNNSEDTTDIDFSEDYLKEEDSDIEIISMKNSEGETKIEKSYINTKATLIICPLSVVTNWEDQISTHIRKGILKVYIHHGPHRSQDPSKMANYDVVISTYNVLALEFNKEKNNENYCAPLHKIDWFRIILDEAHYIKESQTLQSKAACELKGKRRWCLSGTPIQNKIDDLYGLIKFLNLEPFNKKSVWVNYISKPMKSYDNIGITSLQTLMKSIAIRRTKDSKFNGKKLIELPPKSNEYVTLQLSPEARDVYSRVLKQGKIIFNGLVNQGIWAKHYVHILEIILRLRQIATHLSLCTNKDLTSLNNFLLPMMNDENEVTTETKATEIYNILKESAENQCLLCGYDVDNLDRRGYISSCGHLYCTDCIKNKGVFTCVECQKDISRNKAIIIPKIESKPTEFFFNEVEADNVNVKVNRLINDLLRDKQMNDKSIVFSQWTKVFDLLDSHLKKANINYVRLDGQMSRIKRNESIQKFKNDPKISVMLISLKAGGLGLTLTIASRVYLFEPHFNPAAENQAIDRVHRLGQNKPVFVYHYIIENTIEENIVHLQKKKRTLFNITFNRNKKITKEEIENRRLADLKFLFK